MAAMMPHNHLAIDTANARYVVEEALEEHGSMSLKHFEEVIREEWPHTDESFRKALLARASEESATFNRWGAQY